MASPGGILAKHNSFLSPENSGGDGFQIF